MKLLKCHIENFGKLHNFEYEFQDGLNIIKEKNGFGKTTFAAFIKSMFYGLDAGTNVKTEKSDRKKYFPWQGGNYGGNIEFELDGKKYRLERYFGKKQAEDTFKLYDLFTNLESFDYTENIGEEIFRINKSAYERSTYIPQGQIQIEMEDTLSAKLVNVLESDNDINTSEEAIKKLNESKKIYMKEKGKGGLIDEKKEKLNKLQREFENSKFDEEILRNKEIALNEINNQIKKQEILRDNNLKLLSEKVEQGRKDAKQETYRTILTKYEQIETMLNNIKELNNNRFPDGINGIEEQIELEKVKKKKQQEKAKSTKRASIISMVLGVIFIIIGIVLVLANLQKIAGYIIIPIGIVFIVFYFILLNKSKNNNLIEISKKIQELENNKQEAENHEELLRSVVQQFEDTKTEKERYEAENNTQEHEKTQDLSGISEQELKKIISEANEKIDILVDEKNQLKNQIEILENQVDENEYLETDIENLKEEIKTLNTKYQILNKTAQLLEKAKEQLSSSYLQDMITGFNKYLGLINTENIDTNIDINLDVKVDINGSQKEIKYFSVGYKDLIYLCMRFSLIKAIFKNESPFVVLDDPFTNLDEEKTSKVLKVINEMSKEYQIIYFVCNSSRI